MVSVVDIADFEDCGFVVAKKKIRCAKSYFLDFCAFFPRRDLDSTHACNDFKLAGLFLFFAES